MRYLIIIAVLFGITSFINSQTIDKRFIGEWKLIETMIDPGDGSGEFHKVDSEKTLEIEPSGTVKSNGDMCNLSINTDNKTYGQLKKDLNETILSSCNKKYKPYYKLKDEFLIVYYPCKEGCAEKYEKN
jgi:hypothetical protein